MDLIYASIERFSWVVDAFYGSSYSFEETKSMRHGAHSTITTAIFDFGIFYFMFLLIIMFYFIRSSFFISKHHHDFEVIIIAKGFIVTGIVAIILSVFGTTMFSAKYLQVYWLMLGYLHVTKKELNKKSLA